MNAKKLVAVCLLLSTLVFPPRALAQQSSVRLNELLASNLSLTNQDGSVTDWVELFNTSRGSVDLSGASLTDDPTRPRRFLFPNGTTIAAAGYLLVLMDTERPASTSAGGQLNSGFSANAGGDRLFLIASTNNGGGVIDSLTFGLQIGNFAIGRVPSGSGGWVLTSPTPGAANVAATLGPPNVLKINEWMAAPASGDDWFEIYNPSSSPIQLSGLYLTDTLSGAGRVKYPVPALSFIGTGVDAYIRFWADDATNSGPNHTSFKLSADADSLGIFGPALEQIDAVNFTAQQEGISQGRFPDGSNNLSTFPNSPSPGEPNYKIHSGLVINEVLTHSDPPFEDAIEIHNPTAAPINIGGWFLSNRKSQLKRYRIPDNTVVPAGGFRVFYEYQFNGPSAISPFTLNSAHGDEVYLSEADASGNLTGFRVQEFFEAAENGVSLGRFNTSVPGDYKFVAMSQRTFGQDNPSTVEQFRTGTGAANAYAKVGPLVISEIMYHPPDIGTNDNVIHEFVEIRNITGVDVLLYDRIYPTNRWRLQNGVDFYFPMGSAVPANGYVLVVSFDPVQNPGALQDFQAKYSLPANTPVFGPYSGKLDNGSDQIELYKPDLPQLPPHPDAGFVPYLRVDKINYADLAPWPTEPDGAGASLQRKNLRLFGNDPSNWAAGIPTAARANLDSDSDGMPDQWESSFQLNPQSAADASQDPDGDGMANLHEFLAGTDPKSGQSVFKITSITGPKTGQQTSIQFLAAPDQTYTLQYKNKVNSEAWQSIVSVGPFATPRTVEVKDPDTERRTDRYYRIVTPAAQ